MITIMPCVGRGVNRSQKSWLISKDPAANIARITIRNASFVFAVKLHDALSCRCSLQLFAPEIG